jgi:hypothetical protein
MFTTFSLAGSLYLVGVGLVLLAKPALMFSPDGDWKEFGIGQDQQRYTPFPFWLFCLVWALVAYFIIVSMEPQIFGPGANALAPLPLAAAAINAYNVPRRNNGSNRKNNVSDSDSDAGVELPKGYYVLNKKATRLSGVPKYVYLGPEEPQN